MQTDLVGKVMDVGDRVIVARPSDYKTAKASLCVAEIVRFTNSGLTLMPVDGTVSFHTSYRANKFYRL